MLLNAARNSLPYIQRFSNMEHVIARLLHDFERGRLNRRELIQSLALSATAASAALFGGTSAAAAAGGFKLVSVDHISYRVSDYKRTRDFYADLFGLRITDDTGTQCQLRFGDSAITARNPRQPDQKVPTVDHVAYRIGDWDTETVKAELLRRGLEPRLDLGDASSPTNYVSFHVKDPDGYDVQISGVAKAGDSQYKKSA
jgi:catechol 2,3-dioxygenase-like lactoylglutathione lyase family enzyme